MSIIEIKSAKAGRSNQSDFGVTPGARVYYVEYDMPGTKDTGHVHTIPIAALANHRIDSSEVDPMSSLDYYIREAVSSNVTVADIGLTRAQREDSSPLVQQAQGLYVVRKRLEEDIFELAGEAPGDSPEEIQDAVEEVVISPVARLSGARALSVPAAATAASRLDTAQQAYAGVLARSVSAHAVDTSLKPWATLAQMVADDTAELDRERTQWFDTRYGERIRLRAGMRFRGTRK